MSYVEVIYLVWIDVCEFGFVQLVVYFEVYGFGFFDGVDFGVFGWLCLNFGCIWVMLDEVL